MNIFIDHKYLDFPKTFLLVWKEAAQFNGYFLIEKMGNMNCERSTYSTKCGFERYDLRN